MSVCVSGSHTFLVDTDSYVSQAIPRNAATMLLSPMIMDKQLILDMQVANNMCCWFYTEPDH